MLTIKNLTFERHYQSLFDPINVELLPGELLQIKGMNGSGKSTLLRIVASYIEPTEGSVFWQNQPIIHHRDQLHYVGHQNGIKPYLTLHENLQLMSALMNIHLSKHQIKNILAQIGLTQKTHPAHYLSAGQTRRLALARLLIHSQPLWILDEPTTSLDKQAHDLMNDLLNQHLKKNGIAVIATHQSLPFTGKMIEMRKTA